MSEFLNRSAFQFIAPTALLLGLLWLSYEVLQDFLTIMAWAFIVAYIMWPAYEWLNQKLQNRATLSAAVMTGIIACTVTLAFYWLGNLLQNEVKTVYQALSANYTHFPTDLPDSLKQIPWLGQYLQQYLDQLNSHESSEKAKLIGWAKQWLGQFGRFLGGIGKYIMQLGITLVALFFFFRDGQAALSQLRQGLNAFIGDYQKIYLQTAGDTTRAVVHGLVLAAFGQGLIAGIGYAIANVDAPVLLGVITALFALVPMGATLVWLPVSAGLLLTGDYWHGIGLLLWGVLAISTVDNFIRPLVISGAGHIPFLVVLFGVFGGLSAFGAVGLFLGPVILSVLLAVWRTWLAQQENKAAPQ
jgi:P-type Ca2+ transporter type 2C